ncbi:serine/threonine protein kinase [Paenibacillus elgii]
MADNHRTMVDDGVWGERHPFIAEIERRLLPELRIKSEQPHDPIAVYRVPVPWRLVGAGNYAAVVAHPDFPEVVVKVYAPGRPGLEEEAEVYRRLGRHPAYSECLYYGDGYLVLRRLNGITLYDCIRKGIPIPRQVIDDIDEALAYAVSKGLRPHDVHGKNVMMRDGRGVVVDVSDFLKPEPCRMWDDLKKAYDRFYLPPLRRVPIPGFVLNAVRKGYRLLKR